MAISGVGVAEVTVGFLLLYSGYKNVGIKDELTSLLQGQVPTGNPTGPVTVGVEQPSTASTSSSSPAGSSTAAGGSVSANQAIGKLVAAPYGWATGTEWTDLVNLWNRESGWNNQATNPSSGAYGIAQALGHGEGAATQGSVTNEYGGYGISDSEAQDANSGDAGAQITWGLQYIKETYGDPEAAWAHEESAGWY
jgi:resuscitation-promoting factor RpfB